MGTSHLMRNSETWQSLAYRYTPMSKVCVLTVSKAEQSLVYLLARDKDAG